jgi:hypothetical protein
MGIAPSVQGDRDGRVDPGQLLDRQAEGEEVAAHAAELLGERQAEQAELAHPGDDVVGELTALVVVRDHRRDHLAGERGDRRAQVALLRRQFVIHHGRMVAPVLRSMRTAAPPLSGLRRVDPPETTASGGSLAVW